MKSFQTTFLFSNLLTVWNCSGEPGTLRLHRSAEHAHPNTSTGSEGRHQQRSLRELQVSEPSRPWP